MWKCPECKRTFSKENQPHSCRTKPLEEHFRNKEKAKELFDYLLKQINQNIGKCDIVSLPCCIHLFGQYDFLAVLPKKDRIEIRFALDRKLESPVLKQSIPISVKLFKNCADVYSKEDINVELIGYLKTSYYL